MLQVVIKHPLETVVGSLPTKHFFSQTLETLPKENIVTSNRAVEAKLSELIPYHAS